MVSWFLLPITWCINHDGSPLRKEGVSYLLARVRSLFLNDFSAVLLQKDLTIPPSRSEEGGDWWGFFVFLRLLLSVFLVFVFLLLASWVFGIAISPFFHHSSFGRERFSILKLLSFSYYMSVISTFFYYAFMQQDLIFSENLGSVILCLNLLWTEDALNNTIFVDDESSTESTHVSTAIHLLLTINTECLNEF